MKTNSSISVSFLTLSSPNCRLRWISLCDILLDPSVAYTYEVLWFGSQGFYLDNNLETKYFWTSKISYCLSFIFGFCCGIKNIMILQPFKTSLQFVQEFVSKCYSKFPPFVLSLPTSADDVKNVKFSWLHFDLF